MTNCHQAPRNYCIFIYFGI